MLRVACSIEGSGVALDSGNLATEHGRNEVEPADLLHRGAAHSPPVAHDRHLIADLVQLVQLMADEDDGNAIRLQLPDDVEKNGNLPLVQGGSRLVHDHQAGRKADRAGNRHHLLSGGTEIAERPADVDANAEAA